MTERKSGRLTLLLGLFLLVCGAAISTGFLSFVLVVAGCLLLLASVIVAIVVGSR
ncbi:MAG: hypothetical protein Q8R28_21535 [Dehalococcoidia bacterium]|nr:hypothetical protein [Dehalococcoidia bacterium]